MHNTCVRYFHCKHTENKLVTCLTKMALKLRKIWDKIVSFSSSALLIFTKTAVHHFKEKDMNNFLDIQIN